LRRGVVRRGKGTKGGEDWLVAAKGGARLSGGGGGWVRKERGRGRLQRGDITEGRDAKGKQRQLGKVCY
jgi:hypothetical protein